MCVRAHVWVTCPTCLWLFSTLAVGLQMTEGSSVDVPVLFAPNSKELKRAWVCISMRPLGSPGNGMRYVHVSHYLSDRPYLYPVRRVSFCYLLHRGWFPANKTRNKYLAFVAIVPTVLWQHCGSYNSSRMYLCTLLSLCLQASRGSSRWGQVVHHLLSCTLSCDVVGSQTSTTFCITFYFQTIFCVYLGSCE